MYTQNEKNPYSVLTGACQRQSIVVHELVAQAIKEQSEVVQEKFGNEEFIGIRRQDNIQNSDFVSTKKKSSGNGIGNDKIWPGMIVPYVMKGGCSGGMCLLQSSSSRSSCM